MSQTSIFQINNSFYDFGTPNKSFIKTSRDIHIASPNVDNYIFMLELKDPSLEGVDPYKVDTKDKLTIGKIQLECISNIWYFLREVCRIPIQGGTTIPFIANRANMAQVYLFLNGIDSITYIARQLGKSTSGICIVLWCVLFGTTNSFITLFHYKYDMCVKNLTSMKDYIKELPKYLRPPNMITDSNGTIRKLKDNTKEYVNPINNNTVKVQSSATSYPGAILAGRGLTTPIVLIDEFDYIKYIKTIMNSSTPAFRTASENAKLNNAPYGRILISTPGDLTTQEGQESHELVTQMPMWTENLYNLPSHKIFEYVKKNGSQPFLRIEYQYTQLGKTSEWFNDVTFGLDSVTIRRDYLLQRVTTSMNSPFDQDDLDFISNNIDNPIYEISINDCVFQFYRHLDTSGIFDAYLPYIIGVDCSTGTGNDNQAITIINPYNLRIAGEFKSQWLGEFDLTQLLRDLVKKYLKKGVLCIERNSIGSAIIENLIHTDISKHVYYDIGKDIIESSITKDMTRETILKKMSEMKKYAGVYTERMSRQRMFDILEKHVHTMKELINTRNLVEDIVKLVRKPNGKIEAASGFHDDSCFEGNTLVLTNHGNIPIKDLTINDYVCTRCGYKPILHIYKRMANTITKFNIIATPDHPFITPNGIIKFKDLDYDDDVYIYYDKLSIAKVRDILPNTPIEEHKNIVYNLYVKDIHEYFVNNILVHNCMSYLIGLYTWYHGNNLAKFGIDKTKAKIYQENEGMLMESTNKLNSISKLISNIYHSEKPLEKSDTEIFKVQVEQSSIEDEILIKSGLIQGNSKEVNVGISSVKNTIRSLYIED